MSSSSVRESPSSSSRSSPRLPTHSSSSSSSSSSTTSHSHLQQQAQQSQLSPSSPLDYKPPFLIDIPLARDEQGVVFYFINVTVQSSNSTSPSSSSSSSSFSSISSSSSSSSTNGGATDNYSVHKRFSQFETLQNAIFAEFESKVHFPVGCCLPPKGVKMLQSHSDPWFVEERRCLLEAFLQKLLLVPLVADSPLLRDFLRTDIVPLSGGHLNGHGTTSNGNSGGSNVVSVTDHVPDDGEITNVSIPATRTMSDHILYQIDVVNERRRKSFSKWTVLKRFQQVYEMDAALRAAYASSPSVLASLPAPPTRQWKVMYDHLDDTFVEHRRLLLVNYLNRLIRHPHAYKEPLLLEFLGVRYES